jgi:hypothetical protein
MDIKGFVRQLRDTADSLERLFLNPAPRYMLRETPKTAKAILRDAKANNKKPHWTQTPAGKRKMVAAQKKVWAAKKSKQDKV